MLLTILALTFSMVVVCSCPSMDGLRSLAEKSDMRRGWDGAIGSELCDNVSAEVPSDKSVGVVGISE